MSEHCVSHLIVSRGADPAASGWIILLLYLPWRSRGQDRTVGMLWWGIVARPRMLVRRSFPSLGALSGPSSPALAPTMGTMSELPLAVDAPFGPGRVSSV